VLFEEGFAQPYSAPSIHLLGNADTALHRKRTGNQFTRNNSGR